MSLKVISVVNAKSPAEELVWLKASEKVSLKGYAIVDRTFASDGKVSNEYRHIFIFPNLIVDKNHWIRLHTNDGKYNITKGSKDETIHNLYWQSDKCIWNDNGGDTATLIKYSVENSVAVPAVPKK